uniref:Glycosyl hydrolase family 13 catalytic domain-containing protein n=1 Tax=Arion vulgaris TaxID=1028688 RepID=A0A0B6XYM5_9EUPU
MPEPDLSLDGAANEGTKINLNESNTTTVHLDLDESKAHLINSNGGAGGDRDDLKTAIIDPTSVSSDGELSFNGLGKEEVMRYANDPFWVRLRWILFILFWVGWLAMLVTAVVIIVLAPRCPPRPDLKWYQTETVYQVYPKSFKDSNDDGVGDFGGLTEKLSYITTDLGIKAIWISSFFVTDGKSSLGVIDHKDIDKSFGTTLDEFKGWLKKLRKEGMKVILDLIPNQTSKNHTWFLKSQQNDELYKDYYVWANAGGNLPNDWLTVDGKPAWTYDTSRGAWYFHQFSEDYPDLNLSNELVKTEIKDIMKFWMEAGVSGFHIDGVEYLVENPDVKVPDPDRSQTRNYVGTLSLLEELREVANAYSDKPGREKLLFGTVEHANNNFTQELWGSGDKKRLHIVAPILKDLSSACDAGCIKTTVDELLTDKDDQWLGIQLGNQNIPRIASRLEHNDGRFKSRLIVAHTLQLLLPGTPFNYYGDEFGQRNGNISSNKEMDNYRTPMQWNTQENAGFTGKDVKPWLPVSAEYKSDNVQASLAHFSDVTPFKAFKRLVKLRSRESFQWGKTMVCSPQDNLVIFTRKATRFPYFLTVINTGNGDVHVSPEELKCAPSKDEGQIVFHSRDKQLGETLDFSGQGLQLDPFDIVIIEFAAED